MTTPVKSKMLRKRRRGHSYDVAGAGRGRLTRGGRVVGPGSAMVSADGEFRRIDSVARRGGTRLLLRNAESLEEERSDGRRGSDGLLAQRLEVPSENVQLRRRSSPNIWMQLEERVGGKTRPHSTYLELLEEVTSELNLGEQKREEENVVETAFSFLDDLGSHTEVMRQLMICRTASFWPSFELQILSSSTSPHP